MTAMYRNAITEITIETRWILGPAILGLHFEGQLGLAAFVVNKKW